MDAVEIDLISGNRKLETGGGGHQIADDEWQLSGIDLDRVAAGYGAAMGADGLGQEPAYVRVAADGGQDSILGRLGIIQPRAGSWLSGATGGCERGTPKMWVSMRGSS